MHYIGIKSRFAALTFRAVVACFGITTVNHSTDDQCLSDRLETVLSKNLWMALWKKEPEEAMRLIRYYVGDRQLDIKIDKNLMIFVDYNLALIPTKSGKLRIYLKHDEQVWEVLPSRKALVKLTEEICHQKFA